MFTFEPTTNKNNVIELDAFRLLHHLMYLPKGEMSLHSIRQVEYSDITTDARVVINYCMIHSFIKINQDRIELTNCGLDHYLLANNDPSIW